MMIPQNKNLRQLVWHFYVDTAVEESELYCYNTRGRYILSCKSSIVQNGCDSTRTAFLHQNSPKARRNARECHSELVEAVGNNALPY